MFVFSVNIYFLPVKMKLTVWIIRVFLFKWFNIYKKSRKKMNGCSIYNKNMNVFIHVCRGGDWLKYQKYDSITNLIVIVKKK